MFKFLPDFGANRCIGIDLGTVNTLVYSKKHQRIILNEPSILQINSETGKIEKIGNEAKEAAGRESHSIKIVKPLNEGVIADFDLTVKMIEFFIKRACGKNTFVKPAVMICVPVDVDEVERKAVKDAAKRAGARSAGVIDEARAAAIGAGIDIGAAEGNMIVDIGGGSTDVAVVSMNDIVSSTTMRVAGNNIDRDILRYCKTNWNLQLSDNEAERVKIRLATAIEPRDEDDDEMLVKGLDMNAGKPKEITLTSKEVYSAIKGTLDEIVNAINGVLRRTPPQLSADLIDNGIVLAGGGALIKNLDELVHIETGLPVRVADNPLECVVRGAGLALDKMDVLRNIDKVTN